MGGQTESRQLGAVAEVVVVAAAYILLSTSAVRTFDADFLFPMSWSFTERATGSGFLIGAVTQMLLVLIAAYILRLKDVQRAIAAAFKASTSKAWIITAIATAIHIGTAALVSCRNPNEFGSYPN